jgi:hypothetical protein
VFIDSLNFYIIAKHSGMAPIKDKTVTNKDSVNKEHCFESTHVSPARPSYKSGIKVKMSVEHGRVQLKCDGTR